MGCRALTTAKGVIPFIILACVDSCFLPQDLAGRAILWPSVPVFYIHRTSRRAGGGDQGPRPLLPLPAGAHRSQKDPTDTSLSNGHQVGKDAEQGTNQYELLI